MTDTAGYDEEFEKLTADLDLISDAALTALSDAAHQLHHEVANANTVDLIKMLKVIWVELQSLGEGLVPQTDRGRELHSQHTAVKTEMLRRQKEHEDGQS